MIRTLTLTLDFSLPIDEAQIIRDIGNILELRDLYQSSGFPVRTVRILLNPKINLTASSTDFLIKSLKAYSDICSRMGIRWFLLPIKVTNLQSPNIISNLVPLLVHSIPNLFIHIVLDNPSCISSSALAAANAVCKVSKLSQNGFDNFRVGISNGKTNGTPFFPFANSDLPLSYSIGIEAIPLLKQCIEQNKNKDLHSILADFSSKLSLILEKLFYVHPRHNQCKFLGVDASLAPVPSSTMSVGLIYEMLGVASFGSPSSVSLTSFITSSIKESFASIECSSCGFNGVMISPLEDDWLAQQSVTSSYDINTLLLLSTMCGCGLDMVPIPGNTLNHTIACLVLDIINMSEKLSKPLGVRLMPIPSKESHEVTSFNHDFLKDMRIMNLSDTILPECLQ